MKKKPFDAGFTSDFENLGDKEKRIPTIPPEIEFGPPAQEVRQPTPEVVNWIKDKIERTSDLCDELKRMRADFESLAHLIALTLYYKFVLREVHPEREKAWRSGNRQINRWGKKPPKKLRNVVEVEVRKMMPDFSAEAFRCLTTSHHYLNRFLYDMYRMFKPITPQPIRIITAICICFRLFAEDICKGCNDMPNDSNAFCKKKAVFFCPHYNKAYERIRKKIHRMRKKGVPSAKYPFPTEYLGLDWNRGSIPE